MTNPPINNNPETPTDDLELQAHQIEEAIRRHEADLSARAFRGEAVGSVAPLAGWQRIAELARSYARQTPWFTSKEGRSHPLVRATKTAGR